MSIVRRETDRSLTFRQVMGGEGQVQFRAILETPEEMMNKGRLFSLVTLQPGQSIGWHVHSGDSETYCILKVSGEYSDNGSLVTLGPGDVAMVRPGEGHSLLNTGDEPLELIALILFE